jgi:hypothetical protein
LRFVLALPARQYVEVMKENGWCEGTRVAGAHSDVVRPSLDDGEQPV